MVARLELLEAEQLAREGFADEDVLALPLDVAGRPHPAHLMIGVVPGVLDGLRHRPRGCDVEIGRGMLRDCLVRPLLVVVPAERIEIVSRGVV
ncbi:hypothetical protein BLTE_07830 [Blastochloris tepida]|uniref:Uncharacterized protein n=1 Tax=Blastochloris tepida TaxID=2233851 RepID=A0A348FXR5_9HYPH|nr:hypothetical protein BLTE_07830 [Blastochloris tepida]